MLSCRALALLLALVGCGPAPSADAPREATVTYVQDGDSFEAELDGRTVVVRLHGIDAPERDQAFGAAARAGASDLLAGRGVRLEVRDRDDYGRLVARVHADGVDVNLALVEAGLAWHFVRFSADPLLAAAERRARDAARGLWGATDPEPPWEFRQRGAGAREGAAADTTGAYVGNTRSRIFHRTSCPNASCPRCTARFATRAEAMADGYRPAGGCRP